MNGSIVPSPDPLQPEGEDPLQSMLRNEAPGGVVTKKKCKLCNSKWRKEAEEMHEANSNFSKIKVFLDDKGDIIPITAIKNHLTEHYMSQERLLFLEEYKESIENMRHRRRTRLQDLEFTVDVGMVELLRVIALPTNNDIYRDKERLDMMNKIIKSVRDGLQLMSDMDSGESGARNIQDKFIEVWSLKMRTAKTDEEKKLIMSTLQSFKGHLPVQGPSDGNGGA